MPEISKKYSNKSYQMKVALANVAKEEEGEMSVQFAFLKALNKYFWLWIDKKHSFPDHQ